MDILPAIDLLEGKCVRLVQGRYDRVLQYQKDPVEVALQFARAGATWLHVIDLEGARDGKLANLDALRRILDAVQIQVQFGGGVRDEASVEAALRVGAQRVIVGTRALEDWDWFKGVAHQPAYARRIVLGLDARQGKLAVQGWTRETQKTAIEVAAAVAHWPLAAIIYTDIGRDGMLLGPNLDATRALAAMSAIPIIASGGVTDLDDVRRLRQLNLAGVVIGRAIYEGTLKLEDALGAAKNSE